MRPLKGSHRDLFLVPLSVLMLSVLIFMMKPLAPEAFLLQFNPYAILSLLGLVLNIALLVILARRPNHSEPVLWLALFIIFGVFWGGAEAVERMAITPLGSYTWSLLLDGLTPLVPAFLYLFVRGYTSQAKSRGFLTPMLLIGTSSILGLLLVATRFTQIPAVKDVHPWGYVSTSTGSLVIVAWALVLLSIAIARLVGFYRRAKSLQDRRQAAIFIVAVTALLVVAIFTESILPNMGITWMPPLAVFTNALVALAIIVGIYKYGSLTLNPADIAATVLGHMHGGVVATDLDYRVLYSNTRAAELISPGGRDLTGLNLRDIGFCRPEYAHSQWEQTLKDHPVAAISSFEFGSGKQLAVLDLRITKLQTGQAGYVFVMNDVTALKSSNDSLTAQTKALAGSQATTLQLLKDSRELERELKTEKAGVERKVVQRTSELETQRKSLEAIVNGVDFGIYMIGPDMHIHLVNRPMQKMYAQAFDRPYSLEAFDNDVHSHSDSQADIHKAVETRQPVGRAEITRGNRIIRSYRSPIFDKAGANSKLLGIINVMQDITEDKAAERSRDEFFSIASHELRTPLTAIRGNTSMIQDYYANAIKDPALKEMVGDIHDSSVRLITLVNDFLNTSRLEQGKIEFKLAAVALPDLVNETIAEFKAGDAASKVPIVTSLEATPLAMADRDRLKEVLINLIGNAIKFTEEGTITVSLMAEGGQLKLGVTDTGKGIPKQSQGLLFRKFQQASNNILTRDSTQSTGLGLYISKLIMIGMGGEIYLEKSVAGKGSTFAVILPKAKAKVPLARKKAAA